MTVPASVRGRRPASRADASAPLGQAELEAVLQSSFDEIFITDGEGITLRVNAACERLYGLTEAELVGRHVADLEREGVFSPSITNRVLATGRQETVVQVTRTGRRLVVTGTPVFDEAGRITRVVSVARDITELNRVVEELAAVESLANRYRQEIAALRARQEEGEGLVFRSVAMERVLSLVRQVAEVDATVLITGESGVGKEQVARLIHRASPRADGPLMTIDCGALPQSLIESELFGYERGAFTGANRDGKRGLIEMADKGTLFLDEIGELPLSLQVKLLRFLQERSVVRVGGLRPIPVDVRIIAATNRDLRQMVREGRFREDLFWRLNVVPIHVPPLRERPEDILALAEHFLARAAVRYGRQRSLSREVADILMRYPWPGNVRELENLIERLVVTSSGPVITPEDLPDGFAPPDRGLSTTGPVEVREILPLADAVAEVERQLLALARRRYRSTHEMARALRVNQSTVVRKLRRYFPPARDTGAGEPVDP
ncbi:sigma-54 interaction domain-containing protein [Caldinitratiruptor microaerophilus]|uniref:HTH-type transcriptional regulatory protein TyrR n=1 Tax=Caldinitratiruptor microaerophilus TaxID=671077 RepID=A0AA35CR49_9FIRM|nr:sigma 54-interacting transcriptional regulator [Caldinitratiruptor microaerophilus]BDG62426.1 RNA polymerase subunit sigma-54 [Caldinitratiruptor microaerophilus]